MAFRRHQSRLANRPTARSHLALALGALLVASAACTNGEESAPPVSLPPVDDSYWESQGFGYVVEFGADNGFVLHEITPPMGAIPLLPGVVEQRAGTAVLVSRENGEQYDEDDVVAELRFSGESMLIRRPGTLDEIEFRPLPARPATIDRRPDSSASEVGAFFCRTVGAHHAFVDDRLDAVAVPAGRVEPGTSWDEHCAAATSSLSGDASRDEVCAALWGALAPLGDAHTFIYDSADDGECDKDGLHPATFATMRPGTDLGSVDSQEMDHQVEAAFELIDASYLEPDSIEWGAEGEIEHALVAGPPLLYVRILSFSGYADSDDLDADLESLRSLLDRMAGRYEEERLEGVIIDLRSNGGGSDELGIEIASRFNNAPYTAYVEEARYDPDDPTSFTDPQVMTVPVSPDPGFRDAPVAILTGPLSISAAETFTMAMMERAATEATVTRIGERTQGVFSDVLARVLPNMMVVGLPNERYLTSAGEHFEIDGIPPDIAVPVFAPADIAAGRDPAFEAAVTQLRGG